MFNDRTPYPLDLYAIILKTAKAQETDNLYKILRFGDLPRCLSDFNFVFEYVENILTLPGSRVKELTYNNCRNVLKALEVAYHFEQYKENAYDEFLLQVLYFFSATNDEVQAQLLNDEHFQEFFLEMGPKAININQIENSIFNRELDYQSQLSFISQVKAIKSQLLKMQAKEWAKLIQNTPEFYGVFLQMPFYDKKKLLAMAHSCQYNDFNSMLTNLEKEFDVSLLREEHNRFCDQTIAYLKDGKIDAKLLLEDCNIDYNFKDKYIVNSELKYFVIYTIISRYFQCIPQDFITDLNSFVEYVVDPNRKHNYEFPNMTIYDKLINSDSYSLAELIQLYEDLKDKNIMAEFYDDWNLAKKEFVEELNEKIISRNNMPQLDEKLSEHYQVKIYYLGYEDHYLLVHNTSISIKNISRIKEQVVDRNGNHIRTCLSIHDQNHITFFEDNNETNSTTLKLAFDNLDSRFLTFICPEDAFSTGINKSEDGTLRKIIPLKTLMDYTPPFQYNELTYYPNPQETDEYNSEIGRLRPFAIICESKKDLKATAKIATLLDLPIIFRDNEKIKANRSTKRKYYAFKHYEHPESYK